MTAFRHCHVNRVSVAANLKRRVDARAENDRSELSGLAGRIIHRQSDSRRSQIGRQVQWKVNLRTGACRHRKEMLHRQRATPDAIAKDNRVIDLRVFRPWHETERRTDDISLLRPFAINRQRARPDCLHVSIEGCLSGIQYGWRFGADGHFRRRSVSAHRFDAACGQRVRPCVSAHFLQVSHPQVIGVEVDDRAIMRRVFKLAHICGSTSPSRGR